MNVSSKLITITMHQEKYSLTWHTYSDHLRDMMKEIINDELADVTLVTEDKKHIKAHKNILSSCSPVFKDIVKIEQSAKPIIYLKGVNFFELESIMQFIYLGEATFFEEKINDFLDVARSLEIKELCNPKTMTNDVNESSPSDLVTSSTFQSTHHTIKSSHLLNQEEKDEMDIKEVVKVKIKYECDQCHKTYSNVGNLKSHKESAHEGVRYICDQCDYQAKTQGDLKKHIESKHEGVKYECDQCGYKFTEQSNLKKHIKSKHEGVSLRS